MKVFLNFKEEINLQENANENHNKISPHTHLSMAENVEKLELLGTVINVKWYSHYGKWETIGPVLQKY